MYVKSFIAHASCGRLNTQLPQHKHTLTTATSVICAKARWSYIRNGARIALGLNILQMPSLRMVAYIAPT